jgi:hypothetical protein
MAWLETKGEVFRIRFRFGGAKHFLPLHSSDRREADEVLARFQGNLRLIDHWVGHSTDAMRRRYSHLLPAVSQAAILSVFG